MPRHSAWESGKRCARRRTTSTKGRTASRAVPAPRPTPGGRRAPVRPARVGRRSVGLDGPAEILGGHRTDEGRDRLDLLHADLHGRDMNGALSGKWLGIALDLGEGRVRVRSPESHEEVAPARAAPKRGE